MTTLTELGVSSKGGRGWRPEQTMTVGVDIKRRDSGFVIGDFLILATLTEFGYMTATCP